jgi:GntR family transcriptional regulator / MocR family aminotransferase
MLAIRDSTVDSLVIDASDATAISRQLYLQLRAQIANRLWATAAHLPSTRALAAELGISRNTVIAAYEQLATEGYIETVPGKRPRISVLTVKDARQGASAHTTTDMPLSARGRDITGTRHQTGFPGPGALQPGLADIKSFPFAVWRRCIAAHLNVAPGETLGYHSYGGHERLREVIAQYMQSSRGMDCISDRIMITAGAQAAFNLLAHLLLDPGDPVAIEEPGYTGAQGAFAAAGARLLPLNVNGRAWSLESIMVQRPKLIYLTPSCQFPIGSTMPIEQRLGVVRLAADINAWVIEDDFDSEFRFSSSRVPTLQSQDQAGRTIYIGSFAKTMLPDLRLGFIIFPYAVTEEMQKANFLMGTAAPLVTQAAMADFILCGAYARHTRKMKRLYARRRAKLVGAVEACLADVMDPLDEGNGLQITWRFRSAVDDVKIAAAARKQGINCTPLSVHYRHGAAEPGLMIGYAATDELQIPRAVQKLSQVIRSHLDAASPIATSVQ